MGRCDQGIKFFSKIQSARNRFKWTSGARDIAFCSKWKTGKKGMLTLQVHTVRTDDDMADRTDDVADRTLTWQIVGIWHVLLATNGNATRDPITGRHMSFACWLKLFTQQESTP
jgi:hypothetical protein